MEEIQKAIDTKVIISINYKKNPCRLLPLGFGKNKDGVEYLLAFEDNGNKNQVTADSKINLYEWEKLDNPQLTEEKFIFNQDDNQFFKQHFVILRYPVIEDWED